MNRHVTACYRITDCRHSFKQGEQSARREGGARQCKTQNKQMRRTRTAQQFSPQAVSAGEQCRDNFSFTAQCLLVPRLALSSPLRWLPTFPTPILFFVFSRHPGFCFITMSRCHSQGCKVRAYAKCVLSASQSEQFSAAAAFRPHRGHVHP